MRCANAQTLARRLLISLLVLSFAPMACVIPPPPLVDDPAGNTPPRLLLDFFAAKGTVSATANGPPYDKYEILGRVQELNRSDTLNMRVFADQIYNQLVPIDPSDNRDPGNSEGIRSLLLSISGLCDTALPTRGFHVLELYITDGEFTAGREVTPGAGRDNVTWRVECTDPLPGGDGGP